MKQWFLKELIEMQEQLNTDSADLALNFKDIVSHLFPYLSI